jgi:PTS system nitrogen regulatory IIA component
LKALSRIARVLRDSNVASKLRETTDGNTLYALLTAPQTSNAA